MNSLNDTHVDAIHRIYISSSKPTSDRTGLYIIFLLCMLLFILIFYLVYNFISYRRYCSLRKKKKKKKKILSKERTFSSCSNAHEQSIIRSHELPLHSCKSPSIIDQNLSSIPDQYSIRTHLISDL